MSRNRSAMYGPRGPYVNSKPAPIVVTSVVENEAVARYRSEKAIAVQRWQERGTVAPPTSGRHPRVVQKGYAV